MGEGMHGSRLLLVSPLLVLLFGLGLQAHWGMGPYHVNLFVLLASAVLFVALPQFDAVDTSAASQVLRVTRTLLLPLMIAGALPKCTFDYWAFTAMSEVHIFALLLLCCRSVGESGEGKGGLLAAFWSDSLMAVRHSRWMLYAFSTALLLASAAEEQRRLAFRIFVNFPRPGHAPVSALVAGTLMLGIPLVVFAVGRVLYGAGIGHTCMDGDLCTACGMAAALAAFALLIVAFSVIHIPQAILLLTVRGRLMTCMAMGTIAAVGILWFCLWRCHDGIERQTASAAEQRKAEV